MTAGLPMNILPRTGIFAHDYENGKPLEDFLLAYGSISPPFTTIGAQYYFGKDLMTMAGVGFSF